ncbi:MAG: GIY-YIG nuclease family protein [Planctomycetes bacterium]|nr:GIY-YIG nuclease family protein [Planctomycetota bacterium]
MYYAYVLLSLKDEKFYIGFTNNLKRRLKEHNSGKNISTKSRLPLRLIYYEAHLSQRDAARRERYFKTTKGKSTLRQMLRNSLETGLKPMVILLAMLAG